MLTAIKAPASVQLADKNKAGCNPIEFISSIWQKKNIYTKSGEHEAPNVFSGEGYLTVFSNEP